MGPFCGLSIRGGIVCPAPKSKWLQSLNSVIYFCDRLLCVVLQLMISQCSKLFSVEYTASGAAIMTADLLGLDARNSMVDSHSQSRVSVMNCDLQDLLGLDFGTPPPVARHSTVCRPKPAERPPRAHRGGIVDGVHSRRDAILLQDQLDADSCSLDGSMDMNSEAENMEQPGAEDKNEVAIECPVPARRIATRSASLDSRLSKSTNSPRLPVPPPKPNRQRVAMSVAALQVQVDQLTTQLKSTAEQRDAAVARVTELEAELNKYRKKFGYID